MSTRTASLIALLCLAAPATAPATEEGPGRFEGLASVQAFDTVLATLSEMRDMILADATSEREASEGMRFLLRTLAMSQDVTGDGHPLAPHFARMDTAKRKIGGDNPDAEYDNVVWAGGIDYEVSGNRGSVDHLSFTVLERLPNGRQKKVGYLNERELEADENGDFRFYFGPTKPAASDPWIQTGDTAGTMLVRQYIGDRASETLASYSVEVIGPAALAPLPHTSDAGLAASIGGVKQALEGIGTLHRYVSPGLGDPPNEFKLRNSDDFGADISSADNLYVIGTYEVEADEALLVEVEPLDVRFWNLAIENPWHESVDYRDRRTSRTHDAGRVDPDGLVRFVIAHTPTEHPNFLVTSGHRRGFMTFRWVGERDTKPPLPRIERLPRDEAVAEARKRGGRDG